MQPHSDRQASSHRLWLIRLVGQRLGPFLTSNIGEVHLSDHFSEEMHLITIDTADTVLAVTGAGGNTGSGIAERTTDH